MAMSEVRPAKGPDACPDPETLGAYVDATLSAVERGQIERHLADCEDCAELVAEMVAAGDAIQTLPARPARLLHFPLRKGGWVVGGVAAVAAGLVLAVLINPDWRQRFITSGDPAIAKLALAVGRDRTVEGHLTGGFEHGPLRTADRGGTGADNLSLLAVAGELQRAANDQPTAANLHAWGVAQLTLGRYDASVQTLGASRLEANTPRVTN